MLHWNTTFEPRLSVWYFSGYSLYTTADANPYAGACCSMTDINTVLCFCGDWKCNRGEYTVLRFPLSRIEKPKQNVDFRSAPIFIPKKHNPVKDVFLASFTASLPQFKKSLLTARFPPPVSCYLGAGSLNNIFFLERWSVIPYRLLSQSLWQFAL